MQTATVNSAPAYSNKNAAFFRLFTDISGLLDDKERRLHEVSFRDEQSPDNFRPCKYSDSRQGLLINQAALHEIIAEWEEILGGLQFFRETFLRFSASYPFLGDIWQIALLPMFAPVYLRCKTAKPITEIRLPQAVSGLHKIALGVPSTVDLMLMDYAASTSQPTSTYAFAEAHGLLLNDPWCCAGSPVMMNKFDEVLAGRAVARADAGKSFRALFGEPDFPAFAFLMTCQYVCGYVFLISNIMLMQYAFGILAKRGVYASPPTPSEVALSPYEKRIGLTLKYMMGDGLSFATLESIYMNILAESARIVGMSAHCSKVQKYIELMVSTHLYVDTTDPNELLLANDRLEAALAETVEYFQNQIAVMLATQTPREEFLSFLDFEKPANYLRNLLGMEK